MAARNRSNATAGSVVASPPREYPEAMSVIEQIPGLLYVVDILVAIWGTLRLDPATYDDVLDDPNSITVVIGILVLAGLSHLTGQALILILNRASRRRVIRTLLIGASAIVLEFILWSFTVWLIATLVFRTPQPYPDAFRVVGISYAPMILGIVVMVPFAGPALFQILRGWTLLSVIVAVSVVFDLPPIDAVLCAVAGWAAHWFIVRQSARIAGVRRHPGAPGVLIDSPDYFLELAERERRRVGPA
jgi:hypothetical protein